jgi:hypothetical protein
MRLLIINLALGLAPRLKSVKTQEKLKKHYAAFMEMDSTVQRLIKKVNTLFSEDEKSMQFHHKHLFSAYDDYINDIELITISKNLKDIEADLITLERDAITIKSYEKYDIKPHIKLGNLLFSSSQIDRSKELIKIACDVFIDDFNYHKNPVSHAFKNAIDNHFDEKSADCLQYSIERELRFLRFSKLSNKDEIICNLENLKIQINTLEKSISSIIKSPSLILQ